VPFSPVVVTVCPPEIYPFENISVSISSFDKIGSLKNTLQLNYEEVQTIHKSRLMVTQLTQIDKTSIFSHWTPQQNILKITHLMMVQYSLLDTIQGLKHTMRNLKIQNYKSVETIQSLKHTVRNSQSQICKRFSVNIASALKNIKIGQYVKWDI
jgi:hypothetical protein